MKQIWSIMLLLVASLSLQAQDHQWAFGFYGDVKLGGADHPGSFGIQGKYDLDRHSAVQAQVYGRNSYVAVGADYLFGLLDKTQHNFNIFVGGGLSQDFYRYNELLAGQEAIPEKRQNFTLANAQLGLSYYFPAAQLSLYTGYKVKYHFSWEEVQPNYLMFGLRYHIW